MKMFVLAGILLFVVAQVTGCTSPTNSPTTPQSSQTGTSLCHSPYDGTYRGAVSGSGEFTIFDSDMSLTKSPYILTYNLAMTVECVSTPKENNGYWMLKVTQAKVSDPFFGCTNGCTPVNSPDAYWSWLQLLPPGEKGNDNTLIIEFPNKSDLKITPIYADSDAKTIRADQSNHGSLVKNTILGFSMECIDNGETNCGIERGLIRGDDGYLRDQECITMTLDKIS